MQQLFLQRQSKRNLLLTPIPEEHIKEMLEAFQWAPSGGNRQPWTIVLVRDVKKLVPALSKGNAAWALNAGAAFVICGIKPTDVEPAKADLYLFNVGLATENLLLQASHLEYIAHPTGGWDEELVRQICAIPDEARPINIVFVGKPGDPAALDEISRAKDEAPRTRKPLSEIVFEEEWGNNFIEK